MYLDWCHQVSSSVIKCHKVSIIDHHVLEQNFSLKRPYEYVSKFCYMQKADISEILTPPRPHPYQLFWLWKFVNSSFLARHIVMIWFLNSAGNRIIETGNGFIWVDLPKLEDSDLTMEATLETDPEMEVTPKLLCY